MRRELLLAVLSGSGGMLGWGFADFFAKKTIDALGDVTTLLWSQCIGIIPLLLLFFYKPEVPVYDSKLVGYVAFLGIWSGLSYIPTYIAFGKGKVSLLSPLFASYAVVVAILSALFLHEAIPWTRWYIFAVVFIGVLLITSDPKALWGVLRGSGTGKKDQGFKEIFLAICLYSLWLIALDRLINGKPWVPYLLVIRIFSTLALFAYAAAAGRTIRVLDRKLWKYLVLIGFFDVAAFACVAFGFSVTPFPSVVAMLCGAFSLPTMALARVFLKRRTTWWQTVGSLIVVVGIMLLALI